jgi:hypothetical protein
MGVLTVEDILAAKDLDEEEVEVPEWGGSVVIRGLGYGEFVAIRDKAWKDSGEQDERLFGCLLLAASFIDPVLTDDQASALFDKSSAAVTRVSDAIVDLSGLGGAAFVESEATFPEQP